MSTEVFCTGNQYISTSRVQCPGPHLAHNIATRIQHSCWIFSCSLFLRHCPGSLGCSTRSIFVFYLLPGSCSTHSILCSICFQEAAQLTPFCVPLASRKEALAKTSYPQSIHMNMKGHMNLKGQRLSATRSCFRKRVRL
jgi:hypothetical protein